MDYRNKCSIFYTEQQLPWEREGLRPSRYLILARFKRLCRLNRAKKERLGRLRHPNPSIKGSELAYSAQLKRFLPDLLPNCNLLVAYDTL